jgi:hypothetical protein
MNITLRPFLVAATPSFVSLVALKPLHNFVFEDEKR